MDIVTDEAVCFEGFTLDVARRVLRKHDCEVELRPESFDVLCCLVANAGAGCHQGQHNRDGLAERGRNRQVHWPGASAMFGLHSATVRSGSSRRCQVVATCSRSRFREQLRTKQRPNRAATSPTPPTISLPRASRSRSAAWLRRWPVVAGVAVLLAMLGMGVLRLEPTRPVTRSSLRSQCCHSALSTRIRSRATLPMGSPMT